MASLHQQVQQDLAGYSNTSGEDIFVSDSDVLMAWLVHIISTTSPNPRPVTVAQGINARFRFPALINAKGVYVQNMMALNFTLYSPNVAAGPIGPIALETRQQLAEQITEAQVITNLEAQRVSGDPFAVLYGDSKAMLIVTANWVKGKFFHITNFGPAVVRAGDTLEKRCNPPGTPFFQHMFSLSPPAVAIRHFIGTMGKDHGGNFWLKLVLPSLVWANIEKSLKELETLE